MHHQDNDQSAIDEAKNEFRPGTFQDTDQEQRFPVLEGQFHMSAKAINRSDGLLGPQSGRTVGDEKRVLEEF